MEFILFYVQNCARSKSALNEIEKVADTHEDYGIFSYVDGRKGAVLVDKYKIRIFPTLVSIQQVKNKTTVEYYNGDITFLPVSKFIKRFAA